MSCKCHAWAEEGKENVKSELARILNENSCAAFVFEPLVQGAAGMKFHSAKGLDALIALCQDNDVLCIVCDSFSHFLF